MARAALTPLRDLDFHDGLLRGLSVFYGDAGMARAWTRLVDRCEREHAGLSGTALARSRREWARRFEETVAGYAREARSPFLTYLLEEIHERPHGDLEHFVNRGQSACKRWLLKELRRAVGPRVGTVLVLGGWYGALSTLLLEHGEVRARRVVSVDLDPACTATALRLNRGHAAAGRFAARTADMLSLDLSAEPRPDVIVNTSCEHVARFEEWFARVPAGVTLVLQSNDYYEDPQHVNCVPDLEAFARQAPLARVRFAGSLPTRKYTRFMLIGEK